MKPRYRYNWDCGHWQSELDRRRCHKCSYLQRRLLDKLAAPAHQAVRKAILAGLLPALDGSVACVDCGKEAVAYDHREYSRPLDVDPVCQRCNLFRGPAKEHMSLVKRLPIHLRAAGARR